MGRDLADIQAGPCSLTFASSGDLGHTEEGVELNYEPEIRRRVVDEYGTSAVELVLVGENLEVTCRVAEWVIAAWKLAIPAGIDGTSYLGIGRKPGYKLSAKAEQLTIHPLENVGDTTEDVILYKAVASSPVPVGWNNDGDRVFEVTFTALVDATKEDGNLLGKLAAPA